MESVKRVRYLEAELKSARKATARALLQRRTALDLTLRQVGIRTNLDPSTISLIERNLSWNIGTIAKIARFYDKCASQQGLN